MIPEILVYYLLEFDSSILLNFLNKPTVKSEILDAALIVAQEVSKQIIDKLLLVTGIIDTVMKLSRSFIDKEVEKMNTCVGMLDRLFFLLDHSKVLNNSIASAEIMIAQSLNSLIQEEEDFVYNFSKLKSLWLSVSA